MEFAQPGGELATADDVVIENCAIATMGGRQHDDTGAATATSWSAAAEAGR